MRAIIRALPLLVTAAACHPAINDGIPTATLPTVTVRQVLTMRALAGETVVVTGRCVGESSSTGAISSQPKIDRAWQLESGGAAVWVSGPRPASCGADASPETVTARVVQDSIPLLSPRRAVRQFLVVR
jgi:hypothetical protein